ncbi:MAG: 2-oxoglutarate and iron-dependent oxygenase domain-containing protein [Nanoarchaeota archaeon]
MSISKFSKDIPLIDVSSLLKKYYKQNTTTVEIGNACKDIGFFYVINHNISKSHITNLFRETKNFFNSPLDKKNLILENNYPFYSGYVPFYGEKTKGILDSHEAFDMIRETPLFEESYSDNPLKGPNQWPTWMKSFKGTMLNNWDLMEDLGKSLTKGIFISLGLEEKLMLDYMKDPISMQRIIYYPKTDIKEQGIGAHKDYGFVTMVLQDREGLEIKNKEGSWIKLKQIPNSFIVNIGYMIENWTNGLYSATEHKVSTSEKDRTSIIFFIGPSPHVNVVPLESCCSDNNLPKSKPYNYGEYVKRKLKDSYNK